MLLWTAGFDIIYACQDIEVDRRDGLYSIPAHLGLPAALRLSRLCHSLSVTGLIGLALVAELGPIFFGTVIVVSLLIVLEHWLVRRGDMANIRIAFGTVNGVISLALAVGLICDVLMRGEFEF